MNPYAADIIRLELCILNTGILKIFLASELLSLKANPKNAETAVITPAVTIRRKLMSKTYNEAQSNSCIPAENALVSMVFIENQ